MPARLAAARPAATPDFRLAGLRYGGRVGGGADRQEPLSVLGAEYERGNQVILAKIQRLGESYGAIRRARGDGNCFFRSFMFAYLEKILEAGDEREVERVMGRVDRCKKLLVGIGYAEFTWDEFLDEAQVLLVSDVEGSSCMPGHQKKTGQLLSVFAPTCLAVAVVVVLLSLEAVRQLSKSVQERPPLPVGAVLTLLALVPIFLEQLEGVRPTSKARISLDTLLERCRDPNVSNYVVMFFRFVTSSEIQTRADFFEPFIMGTTELDVVKFCRTLVEPMGEESDHIHITALTDALGVPIRVVYLDRSTSGSDSSDVNNHDFFPESPSDSLLAPNVPYIHLLYRPGHYDILYKK
eukprot:jgi/Mesen1/3048/ME000018S02355